MDTAETWHRLSEALRHYSNFTYVDAAWTASFAALMTTTPHPRYITRSQAGLLVGSAEQSFIDLKLRGKLAPGRYIAVTPCFRHVDALETQDAYHQPYFMKAELIHLAEEPLSKSEAVALLSQARQFFLAQSPDHLETQVRERLKIVPTQDGFDLELNGIELGSYGVRSAGDMHWAYGTAIAEPRFTRALASLA